MLGLAEGALVAALLLLLAILVLGRDARLLRDSRALEAFEELEDMAERRGAETDVAAPPGS